MHNMINRKIKKTSNSHPCSAATLNSSSGIESAKFLASWANLAPSSGLAECWHAAIWSSTGGGMYAWFFAPNTSGLWTSTLGLDRSLDDEEIDGDIDQSVETVELDEIGDWGGSGRSTPSSSPSITTLSSSVDGKKLRKRASACHLDAFLNSIQTSIRPGRERAGSKRSRWFVVLDAKWFSSWNECYARDSVTYANNMRPSLAATPSSAFSRPLRLNVLTSEICSLWRLLWRDEEDGCGWLLSSLLPFPFPLESGVPFEPLSRVTLRVKAASRSSEKDNAI